MDTRICRFFAFSQSVTSRCMTVKQLLVATLLLVIFPIICWPQNPPPGLPVNDQQIPIPLGYVDPFTGNVHIEIPLASLTQRGDDPIVAKVAYDTSYNKHIFGTSMYGEGGPWLRFNAARYVYVTSTYTNGPCPDVNYPNGSTYTLSNFVIHDSHFTSHLVNQGYYTYQIVCRDASGNLDPNSGSPSGFTTTDLDHLGYTLTVSNYSTTDVSDVDGFHGTKDTNGNLGNGIGNVAAAISFDSQTGPECLYGWSAYWPPSGPTPGHVYVRSSDGSLNTYTFNCKQYDVSEADYPAGKIWLLSSIVLPSGTSYSFNYDTGTSGNHFGALTSITLPTGGQVLFGYANCSYTSAIACDLASVAVGDRTWNFTYSKGQSGNYVSPTTVVGPARYDSGTGQYLNDKAVYSWTGDPTPLTHAFQQYSGSNTLLTTVSTTFTNSLVDTVTTTLNDTGQSSKVQYQYYNGLRDRPNQIQEWDFGSRTPTRTTKMSYGVYNRLASVSIWPGDGTTGSPLSQTTYTYDEYSANYCTSGVPMLASVTGATNHDDANYGVNYTTRGNVTSISRWVSGNTWVTSHRCYDTLGNVTQEVDGAGHPTSYDYSENWADTTCIAPGTVTHAFPATITDAVGNRRRNKYYTCTGLVQARQDENDIVAARVGTTYTYDFAERPLSINYPDGGQTSHSYSDTTTPVYSTETELITSTVSKSTKTVVDGYGRVTQTQLTSDHEGSDDTDTTYDGLGRTVSISNPYRSTSDPTYGVTTSAYDALGRATLVSQTDGSTVTTTYSGNTATTTDQTGKKKKTQTDAFGRLTKTWEDPVGLNYETDYTYDVLGDLICVQQQGRVTTPANTGCAYPASGDASSPWRIRRFAFDGLSRLTSVSNPESSTTTYTYYDDGPVKTKTSPLPNQTGSSTLATTYSYDSDHRLTGKTYTDTTPAVQFGYDGVALSGCTTRPPGLADSNPKGYRTAMCDASGGTSRRHDEMGRILQERRTIGAAVGAYETDVYNLDGSISQLTALGYKITYTYNGAGRAITAKNGGDPFNYVTSATYAPFGGLTGMNMGPKPITVSNSFNNRLQPAVLSANTSAATIMSLSYDFHSSTHANNGNVFQIVNNRDGNRTQNFTYDSLNRIQTAYTNGSNWGESYGSSVAPGGVPTTSGIDAWGNLWQRSAVTGKTTYEPLNCPANGKNQRTTCALNYDSAGNVMTNGSASYSYDAENRMIAAGGTSYIYDGDGKRVEKCTQGTTPGTCATNATGTLYWTGTGNDPLVETDLAGNVLESYVYFNGLRIARREPGTSPTFHFYFSNHLGTHSIITDANGTMPPQAESDYYPFGGEIAVTGGDPNHYKFTGKERDTESQLDNFVARYFAGQFGSFLSADPDNAGADPANPQSWNAYAYVGNNPLNAIDPDGERPCLPTDSACVTATPPSDVLTTSSNVNAIILATLGDEGEQARQALQEMLNAAREWMSRPRDPGCMAQKMLGGSAIGSVAGGIIGGIGGFESGPGEALIIPGSMKIGFGAGATLGTGYGYFACASGGGSGGGGGGTGPARKWKLGSFKSAQKWANQMTKRGWTEAQIDEAVEKGAQFPATNNVNPGNPATRYVNPSTGRSVVIDNVTNEVFHVGGNGFRY